MEKATTLFDTSYSDKETKRKIDLAVGPAFSWKDRWRMKGIGSRRMVISDISKEHREYMNADHYISTANIELRPKGIIIHFRHKLQAYSWIMPFDTLTIISDEFLRLESEGLFIQFNDPQNEHFINKIVKHQKSQ